MRIWYISEFIYKSDVYTSIWYISEFIYKSDVYMRIWYISEFIYKSDCLYEDLIYKGVHI